MDNKLNDEQEDDQFDKNIILLILLITILLLGTVGYLYFPGFQDKKIVSVITVEDTLPVESDTKIDEYYKDKKFNQNEVPKISMSYNGECRMKLDSNKAYRACAANVNYTLFQNGRITISFLKDDTSYSISGGSDRQPELENYYVSIDTIHIIKNGERILEDSSMNGECHLKMNKAATKFFSLDCDLFNSNSGVVYRFELQNIKGYKRREFMDDKKIGSPT